MSARLEPGFPRPGGGASPSATDGSGGAAAPGAGFTLLEVMIAAMVLVGGMISIMGLFAVALATHRSNIDTARIAMLRADVLPEAARRARVEDPATGAVSFHPVPRTPVPGYPGFFYQLDIEAVQDDSRTEVAVLTLSWMAGGRPQRSTSRHVLLATTRLRDLIGKRFREEREP